MLNLCVSHIPGTVDACPINGQMHLRFRVQKGMIVSSKLIYNCDKNMWHKFRDEAEMKITHTDGIITFTRSADKQTIKLRVNGTPRVNKGLEAYGFEIIM